MAIDKNNAIMDITGAWIGKQVQQQSWYQANSNTITTVGGFIATILAWAAAQPLATDTRIQFAIWIGGFVLTIFGVKFTKNGFSQSQLRKVQQAQAEYISQVPFAEPKPVDEPVSSEFMDAEIQTYLDRQA